MENTFYLEIITPDRQFYTGPADSLVMPALDGEYGVQPGHEPVVTALRPGTVRFHAEGIRHEVVVSDGFAEIMPDYVILLVSSAERPEEIDRARAERARERAEERLRQKQSIREYHLSKAALARAMARLKATRCPLSQRLPRCHQMEHRSRRFFDKNKQGLTRNDCMKSPESAPLRQPELNGAVLP